VLLLPPPPPMGLVCPPPRSSPADSGVLEYGEVSIRKRKLLELDNINQ